MRLIRTRLSVVIAVLSILALFTYAAEPLARKHKHSSPVHDESQNDRVEIHASKQTNRFNKSIAQHAEDLINDGRGIFRFDTFGDEAFFGDTIMDR